MFKRLLKGTAWFCGVGFVLQFGGCLSSGLARDVLIDQALDLLTGNNTVLNLFTVAAS